MLPIFPRPANTENKLTRWFMNSMRKSEQALLFCLARGKNTGTLSFRTEGRRLQL